MLMKKPTSVLLTLLLGLVVITLNACSDDDPTVVEHFYNPVWSPDGSTIIAGYVQASLAPGGELTGPGSPSQPGTRLVFMDANTRNRRVIDLGDIRTQHALYEFDASGTVVMFVQDGKISLVDQGGSVRGSYTAPGNVPVSVARFVEGNGMLAFCAGGTTQLEVRRLVFDPSNWRVIDDSLLVNTPAPGAVIALTTIGSDAFAVRFSNGQVRHYGIDGTLLHTFDTVPFSSVNPWHQRLVYYQKPPANTGLYVLEHEALSFLDFVTGMKNVLVTGQVVDMDVSDERNSMVYETRSGDVWLSSVSGLPLSRIAPQNLMPRFSADGKGLVMIERLNPRTDSLHILRFF